MREQNCYGYFAGRTAGKEINMSKDEQNFNNIPADELDLDEFKELAGMTDEDGGDAKGELPPVSDEDFLKEFRTFADEYFEPSKDDTPAASAEDFDPNELNEKLRRLEREEQKDLPVVEEPAPEKKEKKEKFVVRQVEKKPEPAPEAGNKVVKAQRRQKTGCFGALLFFAFVVGISTLLAVLGWMAAKDVLALGKADVTAIVEVDKEDTVADVAQKLHDAGLVEYPFLFKIYGSFAHVDEEKKISAGSFELNSTMDYRALVTAMNSYSDNRIVVTVTIPEGYELRQIVKLLADNGVAAEDDLWGTLANYDFEYSFLEDVPLGDRFRLEGYLFPDTYDFYLSENTVTAVNKMLANFNSKFTEEMRNMAAEKGMTIREVLTVASMIEREAAGDDERSTIASVIYNRLNSDNFPCIQIDATVQYAIGEHKAVLTQEDLQVDSPYNTYMYPGLPAGPIASPGAKSIMAALNPASTDYYYYALGADGVHHFFRTYDEHINFVNSENFSTGE